MQRIWHVLTASILLVIAAVPLLIAFVLVKSTSRGPFLFWQERVGQYGNIFHICKVRTMYVGGGEEACISNRQDPRVTIAGRVLRPSRIDEIPQLLNILWGDMGYIGPRPLMVSQHIELFGGLKESSDMKPGLIGLEQMMTRLGRHRRKKLRQIQEERMSPKLMCLIVWRSIQKLFLKLKS